MDLTLENLREAALSPWRAVSILAFGVASGFWVALILILAGARDGRVPILDSANLAFHEAGHPLFGTSTIGGTS